MGPPILPLLAVSTITGPESPTFPRLTSALFDQVDFILTYSSIDDRGLHCRNEIGAIGRNVPSCHRSQAVKTREDQW